MESTVAHGIVRDRLIELTTVRAQSIAMLVPLSQTQLDFSPGAGQWSIGEIADHLRLSELVWRGDIRELVALARDGRPAHLKRSLADLNVAPIMVPDLVMSWFEVPLGIMTRFVPDAVFGMMLENRILPMRNPDAATPRARRPAEDLIRDLRGSIDDTRRLIDSNADLDFEQMVSSHPLMGANNVPQMLTLLARHERRHQGQMERVRSDPAFPRK